MNSSRLTEILAFARAGARDHAWKLLMASDTPDTGPDPARLNLAGRLLKDRAGAARGAERRRLYREAAAAYRRSAELHPATYPLINAASLSLLGGADAEAVALARQVAEAIEREPGEPETPYWRAATRAEALLLLARHSEARDEFAAAVGLAPLAWEDHASTLRQFKLILEAQGEDAAWLDDFRPPHSLHFGGHMSFAEIALRDPLHERIAEVIDEEKIGFGYGALAAGADIILAEALVAGGAQLHVVLPGGVESFAAASVDPFGATWRERFEALLARAESVRTIRPLGAVPGSASIALADEIAMGEAVMNARRLESQAVQLLVLPEDASSASDRSSSIWAGSGWRQRLILAPRETMPRRSASQPVPKASRVLAMLAVAPVEAGGADIDSALASLRARLCALPRPLVPAYWSEGRLILAYGSAGEAANSAVGLVVGPDADPGLRIGGHYGVVQSFIDPFSEGERLEPSATGPATAAVDSTPPGTICVTEDFAAALAAAGPRNPATEYVGELDAPDGGPPIGLYALKSYDQLFEPLWGDDAK